MAPRAPPSPVSPAAGSSRAWRRPSRCGTRTSAAAMISSRNGKKCPTASPTLTASARSGRCSSDTSARMRPSRGTCWRAPRACNSPSSAIRAGPSGAGSTCRRWRRDMPAIRLPTGKNGLALYTMRAARPLPQRATGAFNRVALAAAHVVADPLADGEPWLDARLDWDATLAYRRHLWGLGLGVAEAMDTAQRGMGLDWPSSLELIRRSVRAAKARGAGALVFSGAGTDHLADAGNLDDVIRAYEHQVAAIEKVGGRIILMASRALAKIARHPDDYTEVYARV